MKRSPQSGRGFFNLGWAQHFSGRHADAIESFEQAVSLGHRPSVATYNIACANAKLGNTSAALDALKTATANGGVGIGHIRDDDDLESLRGNAGFESLVTELEEKHEKERKEWKAKHEHKDHAHDRHDDDDHD